MKNPVEVLKEQDAEYFEQFMGFNAMVFADGALSKKEKLLMALALDAVKGSDQGVKALAVMALEAGATKEQIRETVRVAGYIGQAHATLTAMHGLSDIL